jgi:hypothetical protein
MAQFLGFTPPQEPDPVIWEWIELDPRSKSIFPFNAASVCKLWHDILAGIPECWTRVVLTRYLIPGLSSMHFYVKKFGEYRSGNI